MSEENDVQRTTKPVLDEELQKSLYNEGRAQLISKNYRLAKDLYTEYLDRCKNSTTNEEQAIAYTNLSICNKETNNLEIALQNTNKAIELNPDYLKARFRKAEILKEMKKFKEAMMECLKINQIKTDPGVKKMLEELYLMEKEWNKLEFKFPEV